MVEVVEVLGDVLGDGLRARADGFRDDFLGIFCFAVPGVSKQAKSADGKTVVE
jgi:hypothetical protein